MLVNEKIEINSCDDFELDIKRNTKLEFKLSYDDSKYIKALVCIIPGGAEDMNDYIYVNDYLARNYEVAVINVNYHCIGNRPHLGASVYLDDIDKTILKNNLDEINLNNIDVFNINSYEDLNNTFLYIDALLDELKFNNILNQNYKLKAHVSFLPFKNEYQNFGIMQAMDIINALLYVRSNINFKTMGGGWYKEYFVW